MSFKRKYLTAEVERKLGIEKRTAWKWGEQGKVRMRREGPQKVRVFDADEIDALAPRIKRNVGKGISLFPSDSPRKARSKR